ncbi:MAG: hypothetical protein IPP99_02480 [Chitinophagaceae bacterium]|nr:hypothetical protein [Chitinophagaceae bacterium]
MLARNQLQARADSQQIQLGFQQSLLKEKQISNQQRTRNYLIGGLALLGLLAFVLYRNISARKGPIPNWKIKVSRSRNRPFNSAGRPN